MLDSDPIDSEARGEDREKQSAALGSLLAAVALTTFRVIVGVATGSLGILAEAAHSGLDLVAAVTHLSRGAHLGRPADRTLLYSHGKVENLSALAETLLLLGTCAWIVREALHRLTTHKVEIEVTFWSFAVMATSIVIDVSRSRVLARTAKKYNSQALRAETHCISRRTSGAPVVVMLGLVCVKLGDRIPSLGWLREADAVAALGVSALVIWVSWRLGRRTIDALVDSAPAGMEERILAAVEAVEGAELPQHQGAILGAGDVHRPARSGGRAAIAV